jgi:CheY-like chemotaxis protein
MAKLVVATKGLAVSAHELGENWVTIGRADGNAFQIIEASVSGRHCEVKLQGDDLLIRDLQSTNGTFIGGHKVSEATLKPGGIVRLGEVELRFEASAPKAPAAPVIKKTGDAAAAATTVPSLPKPAESKPPEIKLAEPKPALPPEVKAAPEPAIDPAKKHHVMFVDDSMAFLEMFTAQCARLSNKTWEIHVATSADRALAVLHEHPMDLVVVDIGMPVLDGLQLLGIINRRYPGIKTAILTGAATESRRSDSLAGGADLFIEKPVSDEGIKVVFNMLNDLVSYAREGFSGAVRHVGLQEVIQMECHGRHSSILEVRNREMRGQIYIESGSVIHAVVGTTEGERAFFLLLALTNGEFQVRPFQAPVKRTVDSRWEVLLMEAARFSDEETAFTKKAALAATITASPPPAPAASPAKPEPAPALAKDENPHELGDDVIVVATYEGKWIPVDGSKK